MKHTALTTIIAPLVLLVSLQTGATNISISITDGSSEPTLLHTNVEPTYYSIDRYADLRARCTNYVTDIQMAQRTAQLKLRQGKVALAAQILSDVLQRKASEIGQSYRSMANPHTIEAIQQAAKLVTISNNEAEKFRTVLKNNTDILKLRMAEQLTNLVVDAHNDLDARFFYNIISQCRSYNCYNQSVYNLGFLPTEYYQGVAELSKRFMHVYLGNKELMAFDPVELSIASQTAVSAAEILSTSLYRRDFACPVTRLMDVNAWINSELATDPSFENLITVTAETRAQMGWALGQIYSSQCATGYPRY